MFERRGGCSFRGFHCKLSCPYPTKLIVQIAKTVEGVMKALSSSQQSEVKAWEEEILPCEHTLTLAQEPLISPGDRNSAISFSNSS